MIIWYCGATKQHQRLNWVLTATHQPRPMWRGSSWVTKRAPEANWRPWCSDGSLRGSKKMVGPGDDHWRPCSGSVGQERGERWKWFTMIEEVSHHFWRSVPSCLKECPRGKDNLGRMWEPLKILKGRAETTAGGWTGSMDGWFGQVQLLVRTTWWRIWPETNWIGVMIASLSKSENQIQTLEAWKGCVVQSLSPGLESLGGRGETKWILWIKTRHRS